jgi:type II secretory pathway component GspD/PulD (secretin)
MRPQRPARARAFPVHAVGLALLAVLAAMAAALAPVRGVIRPACAAQNAGQTVQASLDGAAFKDFLQFMGQFTGLKPVFREDQLPRAGVSLDCRLGASPAELEEIFALVLDAAGMAQTRRGQTLYVLPGPSAQGAPRPGGEVQMQILAVRLPAGQDAEQTALLLDRLRSDAGVVRASTQARAVVLRDLAERVARARTVLSALAAAPEGARAEITPLRHARAAAAARTLEMHFKGLPGKAPAVLALEWSNSLLLAGDEAQLDQGQKLLGQMDQGADEALAMRAFRLRYAGPEQAAEALAPLAAAEKGVRVRVDAEAGAVVVLAGPQAMARAERILADLDRPRPRVQVEAVVAEFPDALSPAEIGFAAAGAKAASPSAGGRAFALALAGRTPRFRGKPAAESAQPATNGQGALDGLAALFAADKQVRVLARPRAAVQDGGEMRVSAAMIAPPQGQAAGGDRFRLRITPRLPERGAGGELRVSVSLEDALNPGAAFTAEAQLAEGEALVLASGADLPKEPRQSGWTLMSGGNDDKRPARLVIVLCARVARRAAAPRAGQVQP